MTKQSRRRTRKNRLAAIDAAALAFTGGQFETSEELWALTVFFERYLERGARGTLKQFGPPKAKKAKVLKLVSDRTVTHGSGNVFHDLNIPDPRDPAK